MDSPLQCNRNGMKRTELVGSPQSLPSARISSLGNIGSPCSVISSSSTASYEVEGEIGREALAEICYSALSRILDFPDDSFAVLIGRDTDPEERQHSIAKNIRATIMNAKRTIETYAHSSSHQKWERINTREGTDGVGMEGFLGPNGVNILRLILQLQTAVISEGLFRIPGSKARIDRLMELLHKSDWATILCDASFKINDFASALKFFLSEQPESLLPGNHIEAYMQATDLSERSMRIKCLQLLTLLLHPTHRLIFQNLLELLHRVCVTESSRMSSHNLALMFAPNLIWHDKCDPIKGLQLQKFSFILSVMIEECYEMFEVPPDVQIQAEEYLRKKSMGEVDVPVHLTTTPCCNRVSAQSFHEEGRSRALEEISKLYQHVQSLPNSTTKQQFLKKFETKMKIPGTPQAFVKQPKFAKKVSTPSKLVLEQGVGSCNLTTPVRPCFEFNNGFLKECPEIDKENVFKKVNTLV